MADLGSIGYSLETPRTYDVDSISTATGGKLGVLKMAGLKGVTLLAAGAQLVLTSKPESGRTQSTSNYTVSGNLQESAVNKQGWMVRIFRRDNGALLGTTYTDASGNFSFTVIGYNGEVSCVAYDDTGAAPDYNALIYDRVTPA